MERQQPGEIASPEEITEINTELATAAYDPESLGITKEHFSKVDEGDDRSWWVEADRGDVYLKIDRAIGKDALTGEREVESVSALTELKGVGRASLVIQDGQVKEAAFKDFQSEDRLRNNREAFESASSAFRQALEELRK